MAESVGLAAAVAQLVGLAVELTKLSYAYLNDVRNASKTRKTYLQEILALTDVLLRLETSLQDSATLEDSHNTSFTTVSRLAISDCYEQLALQRLELEKNVNKLLWPFQEKDLKKTIDRLHRFRSLFSDYVVIDTSSKVSSAYRKLDSLKFDQRRSQLQDWLQQNEGLSKGLPSPTHGTGEWFVDQTEFQEWLEGPASFLWCHGPPGVGKSLLAAIAIEELSKNPLSKTSFVYHYFCDFIARREQTELAILRCLLQQAVAHGSEDTISILWDHKINLTSSPKADDLADAFAEVCRSQQRCYIVVDAIDELEITKQLASRLKTFTSAGCSILVTSRDHPDLRKTFTSVRELPLQASHEQDVRSYVQARFEESDFADTLVDMEPIIEAVTQNTRGLFLLAKMTMDQLIDLPTIKKMRKALEFLPENLNDAFETSLKRIDAQPRAQREIAHRLLGWIVSANRPLRKLELLHAFAVEIGDEEVDDENVVMIPMLLRACAGLVIIDQDRETFGIAHTSIFEHLQGKYSQDTKIHEDIAQTSLAYLCLKELHHGPCASINKMDNRLRTLPFLQYAARSWGDHASRVERNMRVSILKMLDAPDVRNSAFQALHYRLDITNRDLVAAIFDTLPKGQSQLHITAYWGLDLVTQHFLSAGLNVDSLDSQRWTALHWASSREHVQTMRTLLEAGANANCQDGQGWTPLIWACFNGNVPATTLLLDNNAFHLMTDVHGWTALHWAVSRQKVDIVQLLLKHHKQYMAMDQKQRIRATTLLPQTDARTAGIPTESAMELAVLNGDANIFDHLLMNNCYGDKGFNAIWHGNGFDPPMSNMWRTMNKAERSSGVGSYIRSDLRWGMRQGDPDAWKVTMLHAAIKDHKLDIVQLLISMGTDVNPGRPSPRSPLHAAACQKDPRFARILLENQADVSALDLHGQTALHQAILNGFVETAKILVEGGSDVNSRLTSKSPDARRYSCSSYHRVSDESMQIEVIQGRIGFTPLMLAAGLAAYQYSGEINLEGQAIQTEMFDVLLGNGADVNLMDKAGRTCLHLAACTANGETIRRLLDAGAEVSVRDNSQAVPLHYAAQSGNEAATEALIEAGADIFARESSGIFIIHSATLSCNVHTIGLLISKGVDVEEVDGSGRNLIHYFAAGSRRNKDMDGLRKIFTWLYPKPNPDRLNAEYAKGTSRILYQPDESLQKHTALSRAICGGNWNVFSILRDAGAHIREPCLAFVQKAIQDIQPSALQYLLDQGLSPDVEKSLKGELPYFYINDSTDLENLDALLGQLKTLGYNLNNVSYGSTKLSSAAASRKDQPELARILLHHGANPYDEQSGLDCFLLAATHQNWGFLHALLVHAHRPGPEGHWIGKFDHLAEDQDELARFGSALELSDTIAKKGHQMFASAANQRNEKLAQLLLLHGLDFQKQDELGWTALHHAVLYEITGAVKTLLEQGANVNTPTIQWADARYCRPSGLSHNDKWAGTALHLATMVANEEIFKMLLDHGADVNATTGPCDFAHRPVLHGPTALHIALGTGVSYGLATNLGTSRPMIARTLIEKGASTAGVGDHLVFGDLAKFEGFEDVWEQVRIGISSD